MNWVAILAAVLGAGGIGAAIREIASVISLARKGVSGKEDRRRDDLVAQRDHALELMRAADREKDEADARADHAESLKRKALEALARTRRIVIEDHGGDPGPWPDFDNTDPPQKRHEQE